jgi:N-acetylmuramoyl-L-alanine amidase
LIPAVLGAAALAAATLVGAPAGGAPKAPGDEPVNAVALTAPQEAATSGFAETLDVDPDTQLVGVKWNGSEEPGFTIEVQNEDGTWSAPYPADPMDIGPDAGTAEAEQVRARRGADHATDGVSIDGSDKVRVRMADGLAADVELVAIGGDAPEPTGEPAPPPAPPSTAAPTTAPPASTTTAPATTTSTPATPPTAPADQPPPPSGPGASQSSALTVTGIGLLALAAIAWTALRPRDRRRVRRRGLVVVITALVALTASGCVGAKGPATGPPPWPGVFGRAHWGAPSGPPCSGYTSNVRFSVVHHTGGGPADNNYSNSAAKIHGIWQYHLATGYCDIAYNFLVDKFGTLWEGRAGGVDKSVMGAHSAGFNTASTGVAILGDFTSVNAPFAAQDALVRLLAWKLWVHHVDPYTPVGTPNGAVHPIAAHRETYPTSCPGDSFYPSLGGIRAEVGRRVFYGNPVGLLDKANRSGGQITVAGWALDPDTFGPIDIHVYVGNQVYVRKSNNLTRGDVAALYPGYGSKHGYQYTFPAPPGSTQVCVFAINVSHGTGNPNIGCATV